MNIVNIKVMRGPNYWSNYRKKLIVMKLDLEEFKDKPSNEIGKFPEALKKLLPSLFEHRCSVGVQGGFFERLSQGTFLGHVIEHVALEIQYLAGMFCGYGRTRTSNIPGVYHVVFSYIVEDAGVYVAKKAVEIVKILASGGEYLHLANDIAILKKMYADARLGSSTEAIIEEAERRNIPHTKINDFLFMLGYGSQQKLFSATLGHNTSTLGVDIAQDKNLTKQILQSEFIPVPEGNIITQYAELQKFIEEKGFPLVIKPRYGNHGRGVTINIENKKKAKEAFESAKKIGHSIVVEKYIKGDDYRFLMINYKLVAVSKRFPAHVVGDGVHTIDELINLINQHPHRGKDHENNLTQIEIDETTLSILKEKNLSLGTILPKDEILYLKYVANISTGGTAIDVTDTVHPYNVFLAERVARLIQLDVCGIDLIAENISQPIKNGNGAIIEVNAAPGLRMHLAPSSGPKRNVAKPFVDLLFPHNSNGRIPIVAVTGTNGKTTVVRLLSHLAMQVKYSVGTSTTEGIYINNQLIYEGDCSGPFSAKTILRDPSVNFAVLECARGGVLRSGLGFDHCSTSIVTNISEDHLGQDDIHTLEELTQVKGVIPHSTLETGYAILNAEDDRVYHLKDELVCHIALFGLKRNTRIVEHCEKGFLACYIDEGDIYIENKYQCIRLIRVEDIPITLSGKAIIMQQNILPVILAAYTNNISIESIRQGLLNFLPSEVDLPGRMNMFKFKNCQVLVDYAHNEKAYLLLKDYLSKINAKKKVCIIAGTGDRRSNDIRKTGMYSAQMFDEIIIRYDEDSRGRTQNEITNLILEGINSVNSSANVQIIANEFDAVRHVISQSTKDTFVWYFPDKILRSIKFLKQLSKSYSG